MAIIYLGVTGVLYFLQDKLIFPGASTRGTAEARVTPHADEELVPLTMASGEKIVLLFGPALNGDGTPHPDAANRPTIIYFYGNGMSLSSAVYDFPQFRKLGVNVAGVEFVGYGMSTGKPSEAGVYESADAAYSHLISRRDVDPKQIIPFGWSLGGAAAIHLASTKPVAGLAKFSAFTNMPEVAQKSMPYLPVKWLVKHKFDNELKMASIRIPTFLSHGRLDSLVPFEMNARLAAAAKGKTTVVAIHRADHNDIFAIGGKDLLLKLSLFFEEVHH